MGHITTTALRPIHLHRHRLLLIFFCEHSEEPKDSFSEPEGQCPEQRNRQLLTLAAARGGG